MLEFGNLQTPPHHGDVLIAPSARQWAAAALRNQEILSTSDRLILDRPLAHWRDQTRRELAGTSEKPLIVLGHQPAFIHPGVWAKHVVAFRLAESLGGLAMNLIVDSDVPKTVRPQVPIVEGGVLTLRTLPFPTVHGTASYEQIARQSKAQIDEFESGLQSALDDALERSQIPTYLAGMRGSVASGDWVDQAVAGRRAVDAKFGIRLIEERISRHWCTPLVCDMVIHAARFAASYNRALCDYRRANGIRGTRRPMPDMVDEDGRHEVPLWFFRNDGSRWRVFVSLNGSDLSLFAEGSEIVSLSMSEAQSPALLHAALSSVEAWVLRPRALALTIWARLLLSDLFVHGIGGAKYDDISDTIMRDYYGVDPPAMACASATLHLKLPCACDDRPSVPAVLKRVRDLRWNPHRHLPAAAIGPELLDRRRAAIAESESLRNGDRRNRRARRRVFESIRRINQEMLAVSPGVLERESAALDRAIHDERQSAIGRGREYFFALFDDLRLELLMAALPGKHDFRV